MNSRLQEPSWFIRGVSSNTRRIQDIITLLSLQACQMVLLKNIPVSFNQNISVRWWNLTGGSTSPVLKFNFQTWFLLIISKYFCRKSTGEVCWLFLLCGVLKLGFAAIRQFIIPVLIPSFFCWSRYIYVSIKNCFDKLFFISDDQDYLE